MVCRLTIVYKRFSNCFPVNKMSEIANLRNIEIKARFRDASQFQAAVEVARKLSGDERGEILVQRDVFFNCTTGRLKLRYEQGRVSRLIQYSRPDTADAKLSEFQLMTVAEPGLLEQMLRDSVGIRGIVEKTRHLFMIGQTRVHLDNVKDLGHFFELEVCLSPEQTIEHGNEIAQKLRKDFGIEEDQLMSGAYMDELEKGK